MNTRDIEVEGLRKRISDLEVENARLRENNQLEQLGQNDYRVNIANCWLELNQLFQIQLAEKGISTKRTDGYEVHTDNGDTINYRFMFIP